MRLATAASDVVSGDLAPCDDGHLPSGPDGEAVRQHRAGEDGDAMCAQAGAPSHPVGGQEAPSGDARVAALVRAAQSLSNG